MLEQHLTPECQNDGYCRDCAEPVRQGAWGGWYVTMGHAGFNSPTNNGEGYATRAKALAAHRYYKNRSAK